MSNSQKQKPIPVKKVTCPNCGELMIKIYPWSSLHLQEAMSIPICKKCMNRANAKLST